MNSKAQTQMGISELPDKRVGIELALMVGKILLAAGRLQI